jgi:hypothetical protein
MSRREKRHPDLKRAIVKRATLLVAGVSRTQTTLAWLTGRAPPDRRDDSSQNQSSTRPIPRGVTEENDHDSRTENADDFGA